MGVTISLRHATTMQRENAETEKPPLSSCAGSSEAGERKYYDTLAKRFPSDRCKYNKLTQEALSWSLAYVFRPSFWSVCLIFFFRQSKVLWNTQSRKQTLNLRIFRYVFFFSFGCTWNFFHKLFLKFLQSQRDVVKKSVKEARKDLEDLQVTAKFR